tara:strand:+ start:368 stop:634 length:267 start_codon:yes stop_codon:yes gene_type:complete
MNYRLTVHLEEVKPVRQSTGKKIKNAKGKFESVSKVKLFNTLSFYCKSVDACMSKLAEVRLKHKIAKGKNNQKMHKYGKELYNISFVN